MKQQNYEIKLQKAFMLTPAQLRPCDWDTAPDVGHNADILPFVARHANRM